MCILCIEENKLNQSEGEECTLKRIYGKDYKCKEATAEACSNAEEALASNEEIKGIVFSNQGAINEKCFLPFKLDYGRPSVAGSARCMW